MKGNNLVLYKKFLNLNAIQREVLVGTLLGDATIPKQKLNSNYNVKFEQKFESKEYVYHLYQIFENFVGTGPSLREIRGGGSSDRYSYWFRTYRHECFTEYYNIFYKNGKKIVPLNIEEFLTPRALAFWFMDDGHKEHGYYVLNTYAFTYAEQSLLVEILRRAFNLDVSLRKDAHQYRISFRMSSSLSFKNIVEPFIVPCMKYKLY